MSNASVTAKIKEAPAPKEAAAAATPFETQETVAKRTSVKLTNVLANGQSKRASLDGQLVWYDTAQLARPHPDDSMFVRVVNSLYSGVVVYPGNVANLLPAIPTRMRVVLRLGNAADIKAFREGPLFAEFKDDVNRRRIVAARISTCCGNWARTALRPAIRATWTIATACSAPSTTGWRSTIYGSVSAIRPTSRWNW
ncbi:hypothetical protein [Burkholderia contaminans]|uniref:hypothetical protein n=1 Tax=Burkholderia contaminans TaxID=488447 RepID=UPI003D663D4D